MALGGGGVREHALLLPDSKMLVAVPLHTTRSTSLKRKKENILRGGESALARSFLIATQRQRETTCRRLLEADINNC